jgi:hypothetical protein
MEDMYDDYIQCEKNGMHDSSVADRGVRKEEQGGRGGEEVAKSWTNL